MKKRGIIQSKKGKTFLSAMTSFAIAVFCFSGISISALAADGMTAYYDGKEYEIHASGDYQYIVVDKKAVIVKYLNTASSVAIPSTIDNFPVTVVGYSSQYSWSDKTGAFEDNSSVQSVVIPSSVEKIDTEAFRNCSGLQQVLVGSGTKEIGTAAFQDCEYMQKIQFTGDALETIGEAAFWGDSALDDVVLPEKLATINTSAFRSCTALSTISIPDSVTTLGGGVFADCTSLSNAVIGNGVEELITYDSYGNYLRSGTESYKDGTFEGCTSLATVSIGTGVKTIGTDAFARTALTEINIPDNVVTVEKGAFYDCDSTTKALIGNGVKTVGDYAFWSNNKLEEVTIGKKVNAIGDRAFRSCTSLKNIVIPSNVTHLGAGAFSDCIAMSSAVIGNGVESLTAYNDYGTYLSTGVERYWDGAFEGCVSMESVTIGNGVKTIGTDTFANTALTKIDIPDNVVTIEKGAFYNCDSLEEAVVGDGVTSIGEYAFFDCNALKDIQLGKGVVKIGDRAFRFCTVLQELNLPSNITSIGSGLCSGDIALKKVIIGNGITELTAYNDYGSYLGTGSERYWDGAFEGCTALAEVAVGSGLTTIGTDTFADTVITSLFVPRKVSSLGKGAFYNTQLADLYFAGVAPTFESNIFGTVSVPTMYCLSNNKNSFDSKTDYVYSEFTPVTVKFDSNGVISTLANDQIMAPKGGYVIEPIPLAAEDYLFLGWYVDAAGTKQWDFMNDEVTGDTTLYAKWVKTSEALPETARISDVYESTSTTADITWQEVSGAKGYNIYQDGTLVGTVTDGECKYRLMNLQADTSYEITVTALNDVGESEQSLVKVIQTTEKSDEPDNPIDPDDPQPTPGDEVMLGDVDGNTEIDLSDVQQALQAYLGMLELSEVQQKAADVDESEEIDLTDVQLILQYYLGIIETF